MLEGGQRLRRQTAVPQFDAAELNPLRRQPSGISVRKQLWEVHYDPYDVSRVWLRNHWESGWITLYWKHLSRDGLPFGELAWDHVRGQMPAATEAEIAAAVQELLRRANRGPGADAGRRMTRRDRTVAARTRATAQPTEPGAPAEPAPPDDTPDDGDKSAAPLAKVIPLGIFDPYQEATKRW
jgi:putative transposase